MSGRLVGIEEVFPRQMGFTRGFSVRSNAKPKGPSADYQLIYDRRKHRNVRKFAKKYNDVGRLLALAE